MTQTPIVFVVDNDDDVRESIRALLETAGYSVEDHASARSFLGSDRVRQTGCLVCDIRMPEMTGLQLQEECARRGIDLPTIFITGHGDVALAVRAMKAGAVDFIEKPFDEELLVAGIQRALEIGDKTRSQAKEAQTAKRLIGLLTPRERHVLEQLVAGRSNKVAAHALGISPRTVEIHRARIMGKMNARSLSDVVRLSLAASLPGAGEHP